MGQDAAYWSAWYPEEGRPAWDLGGPSPLLAELLDLAGPLGLGRDWVVPGCGFGHDAAELARRGFRVTGVDFAAPALAGARIRHGDLVEWRQADWFEPGPPAFDGVFDYTCFVAMEPARRADYVAATAAHLRPGGLWLGGFFHTVVNEPGPPFAIPQADLLALLPGRFEPCHLGPAQRSHPRRAGREYLLVARRA